MARTKSVEVKGSFRLRFDDSIEIPEELENDPAGQEEWLKEYVEENAASLNITGTDDIEIDDIEDE